MQFFNLLAVALNSNIQCPCRSHTSIPFDLIFPTCHTSSDMQCCCKLKVLSRTMCYQRLQHLPGSMRRDWSVTRTWTIHNTRLQVLSITRSTLAYMYETQHNKIKYNALVISHTAGSHLSVRFLIAHDSRNILSSFCPGVYTILLPIRLLAFASGPSSSLRFLTCFSHIRRIPICPTKAAVPSIYIELLWVRQC